MSSTYACAAMTLVALGALGGCSSSPDSDGAHDSVGPSGRAGTLVWDAPNDYEFVLESRCGERSDIGRYEISVAGGDVTHVNAPTGGPTGADPGRIAFVSDYKAEAPSLVELADEATAAEAAGAEVVRLSTDPADGRPTRLEIDWDSEAADDEACFMVTSYEAAN